MQLTNELIQRCRQQFPALSRMVNDSPAIFLDGPAGTQVPQGGTLPNLKEICG